MSHATATAPRTPAHADPRPSAPPSTPAAPSPLDGRGTWRDLAHSFDEVVARLPEALAAEGFGVVTQLDLQATFKAKLGVDFPPYRLFGVCNPGFALHAVTTDPRVGLLLPCNVVVRARADGGATLGVIDPVAQLGGDGPLAAMAAEVGRKLERVADRLA